MTSQPAAARLTFDGYLKVYGDYDSSKDVILPELEEGEQLQAAEELKGQPSTSPEPPARYTEARLIKAMEEEGIGRPSTYAMIIDTIQARGYVTLERTSPEKQNPKYSSRPTRAS